MVNWIGNVILAILALPLAIGIVDLWWIVLFNKMLILDHWSQQTFTAALLLAGCGLFVKIATIWISDK
jgi:hypothetical protein